MKSPLSYRPEIGILKEVYDLYAEDDFGEDVSRVS